MPSSRIKERPFGAFIIVFICFTLLSCGYSVVRPRSACVSLKDIFNKTHEPGAEDIFTVALAAELMKRGVRVNPACADSLSGSIESIDFVAVSEKDGYISEYTVKSSGTFELDTLEGKLSQESGFYVTLNSTGELQSSAARRRQALEQALGELALEVASKLVYR